MEINYIVQISVRLRHFDQAERVEKSPRKRPYKAFIKLCHCEARFCAVAIPEKVPFVCNYLLLWLNYRLRIYCRFQRHCLCNTPTAPLPRPPTPHGQGNVLSALAYIITDIVRKFAYFSNRNYVKLRSLSAKNYAKVRTFYFSNYVKLRSFALKLRQ